MLLESEPLLNVASTSSSRFSPMQLEEHYSSPPMMGPISLPNTANANAAASYYSHPIEQHESYYMPLGPFDDSGWPGLESQDASDL